MGTYLRGHLFTQSPVYKHLYYLGACLFRRATAIDLVVEKHLILDLATV